MDTGNKLVRDIYSGNNLARDMDTGNKLGRGMDTGKELLAPLCAVESGRTKKPTGTVSRTATLSRGTENSLEPKGRLFADGAGVPHWYSTYVSFTSVFVTTCRRNCLPEKFWDSGFRALM